MGTELRTECVEPQYGIVYIVVNTANGKYYIGKTKRALSERWSEHVYSARTGVSNGTFPRAIRKYGADAFVVSNLDSAPCHDSLNELESHYIGALKSHLPNVGYNCTMGGEGVTPTPETIEKMRAAAKITHARTEWKAKMSAARSGPKNHNYGKAIPLETRLKISEALIGKEVSAETRAKLSVAVKLGLSNAETRKKISDAAKRRGGPSTAALAQSAAVRKQAKARRDAELADMAAAGLSAKDIAEKLGVTRKNIVKRLSKIK